MRASWNATVWEVCRPSDALLLRLYNLLDGISPFDFRRNRGNGGGTHGPEPEDERDTDPWSDPALWMLMLH